MTARQQNTVETSLESQLASYSYPQSVVDAWKADGINYLLPIQEQALASGLLTGVSALVLGPTSSGKTFVGEMAAVHNVLNGTKCVYLVPFKALAEEKYQGFVAKYGQADVGAEILISTADRRNFDRQIVKSDFDIAILTYEKLSALLVLHPSLAKQIGTIIVDEVQMVSDSGRGAELELLLTRIRQIAPNSQLVCLSAAASDLNGFDTWLNAVVVKNDHRPVSLREGAVAPNGEFEYVQWHDQDRTSGKESLPSYFGRDEYERAASFVADLLADQNQQVLVFANSIAKTQALASDIASRVNCDIASDSIQNLTELESSESIEQLRSCLNSGIGFHNSELTFEERQAVERGFREREVRCVVCTSTLAMGVNLPASTVVIVKPTKWTRERGEWSERPISVAEYKNMSGRSGRFGFIQDDFGRSVIISSRTMEQAAFLNSYIHGNVEPITSAMAERELALMLLKLFASGLCETEDGAVRFLLKTYCASLHWKTDQEIEGLRTEVGRCVSLLTTYQLVESAEGKLAASKLGKVCASSGLEIETFGKLVSFVKSGNTSVVDIARLASGGKETGAESGVGIRLSTAEFKGRTAALLGYVRDCANTFASRLTSLFVCKFDVPNQEPTYEEAKELKYQSVAMAFVQGGSTRSIENQFGARGGKIRAIGGMCSWLADTAAKVGWLLGRHQEAGEFEIVADRFASGCSAEALFLTRIPNNLYRAEREALVSAGYTSYQSIVNADATEVARTAKVTRGHVQSLQEAIVAALGNELDIQRQQLARLSSNGVSGDGVEAVCVASGTPLERELENLCAAPFCLPAVQRITEQRSGEADLRITFTDGTVGIAQVNARDPHNLVGVVKSGAVLQQSPELRPQVFICIGRPGFDDNAIRKADSHAANGTNFKLLPVSTLAEMFVRFAEGRMSAEQIEAFLQTEVGHLGLDKLPS